MSASHAPSPGPLKRPLRSLTASGSATTIFVILLRSLRMGSNFTTTSKFRKDSWFSTPFLASLISSGARFVRK